MLTSPDVRSAGIADHVDLAGSGAHDDAATPHGGRRLDAAIAHLQGPQLGRVDAGVADVVRVHDTVAVSLQQDVVDHHLRAPDRAGQELLPQDFAGGPIDPEDST